MTLNCSCLASFGDVYSENGKPQLQDDYRQFHDRMD